VCALKVKAHLLASFGVPSAGHGISIDALLGACLATRDTVDDEDKINILDLQSIAAPQHHLTVFVVDILAEEAVLVQRDGFEDALLLVKLDLQMFSGDSLCSASNIRSGGVDADEGDVVRGGPENAEIDSGRSWCMRDVLPIEGRVPLLLADLLACCGL
jgi:hypothetical protein